MTEPGLRQLTGVPTGLSSANDLGATAGSLIGTSQILLWDARTEVNEEPGLGPNQAPLQPAPHTGTREQGEWRMIRNCRDSTVGFYLDTARFHWASAGAFTPSSISEPHRCEVRRAGAQRLRAGPRANAHLCELSATRFALRPWRKLRRRPGNRRSRNHRVRPPAGGCCKARHVGLHRRIHFGGCRNTQRTAGDDPLGVYRFVAPCQGNARAGQGRSRWQRDHRGWCHLRDRFWAHCRGRNRRRDNCPNNPARHRIQSGATV